MKFVAMVGALVLGTTGQGLAEEIFFPRNPNIEIEYVPPSEPALKETHDRMQKLGLLQTLREFLSPLKLPKTIRVRMASCGGQLSLPYRYDGVITVCYEHVNAIRATAPRELIRFDAKRTLTPNQAVAGGVARLILYETAFGVFDTLGIPIWGRIEEAADNTTALIMLDFGQELAWSTILGSAWYLAQRGMLGTGFFTDSTRPLEAQRFYNYLCLAYGRHADVYGFLVNGFNLPQERARNCAVEYHRTSRAFRTVFRDHIDRILLERVQARRDWLKN